MIHRNKASGDASNGRDPTWAKHKEKTMIKREGMTAGEVRRATGISRPRLRNWERLGILSPVLEPHYSRTWRVYTRAETARIARILELLEAGWSLRGAAAKASETGAMGGVPDVRNAGERMEISAVA